MAKVMTLTRHAKYATVKRDHRTKKHRLTRASRQRAIRLYRRNDTEYNKTFYVISTTGL
jgi:hypothetical protein